MEVLISGILVRMPCPTWSPAGPSEVRVAYYFPSGSESVASSITSARRTTAPVACRCSSTCPLSTASSSFLSCLCGSTRKPQIQSGSCSTVGATRAQRALCAMHAARHSLNSVRRCGASPAQPPRRCAVVSSAPAVQNPHGKCCRLSTSPARREVPRRMRASTRRCWCVSTAALMTPMQCC